MDDLFLGVDAGATHTRVAVCNAEGQLMSTGVGGPGHCLYVGVKGVVKSLREALMRASVQNCRFKAACFASASVWVVPEYCPCYNQLKQVINGNIDTDQLVIENDACAALWGAFLGQPGIACIAGTGALVLARTHDGKVLRVGGWGHLLGDEGSAYRISLDAIQMALQAYDGVGRYTTLLAQACKSVSYTHLTLPTTPYV